MGIRGQAGARELETAFVVGGDEASAVAVGGSDLHGVALVAPRDAFYLGFSNALDAWHSTSGATYVGALRQDPLFVHVGRTWARLAFPSAYNDVRRVRGFSGARPEDDELYALAQVRTTGFEVRAALLWRNGGAWRELALPEARPRHLAPGPDRTLFVSLGGVAPHLLSVRDGEVAPLAIPPEVGPSEAVGLCPTPDGALFACFAKHREERAAAWLLRDGAWAPIASDTPLSGFGNGFIDAVCWHGRVHVATNEGLHALVSPERLARVVDDFRPVRLWPLADALVATGYHGGRHAHRIHRGDGWEPLFVPRPEVVRGALGKRVSLAGVEVPAKRVRMAAPPPVASGKSPSPTVDGYVERFLEARVFGERSAARTEPVELAARAASHHGVPLPSGLVRWLRLVGARTPRPFGELVFWDAETVSPLFEALPPAELLGRVYAVDALSVAAMTGTVPLGSDGGDLVSLLELHETRTEAFLYAPNLGDVRFLARDLDAFFFLHDVAQQWSDHARQEDLDGEDALAGRVDRAAPPVRAIARGLASLEGRVDLGTDHDVFGGLHEVLPEVAGVRPEATSSSPVPALLARARWVLHGLGGIGVDSFDAAAAAARDLDTELGDPSLGRHPATQVYWLWHLAAFDDPRLPELADWLSDEPSSLVRATAALLRAYLASPEAPELAAVRALRDALAAALARGS